MSASCAALFNTICGDLSRVVVADCESYRRTQLFSTAGHLAVTYFGNPFF